MASKGVTDREKSATAVVAIAETQADAAGQVLQKLFKPHVKKKGDPVPDYAACMLLIARAIEGAKKAMVDADTAHDAELGDDDPIREHRDEAAAAVTDKLVELREVLTGLYGVAVAATVLQGPTPHDPVVLSRFAGDAAGALKRIKLPAPRVRGAKLDVTETASQLAQLKLALDDRLKDVAREAREAQATLDAKTRAIAAYDETFAGGALALVGLLRLAGKPELAAKVRPSTRRPGQTASDAGDETPAPEAPAGPAKQE